MKHFYTANQYLENGDISICEWDVIKETPKTVTYNYNDGDYFTKNKDSFNKVHLTDKQTYTGRSQEAYILIGVCDSKEEAIEKAKAIYKEWHNLLIDGLNII